MSPRDRSAVIELSEIGTDAWSHTTAAGFRVDLQACDGGDTLVLHSPQGALCARLSLREDEVLVELQASILCLRNTEHLRLESKNIELDAEHSLRLRCDGLTESRAFEHHIESTHGEIRLEANDDVALDGERIRLNSPKPTSSTVEGT